jgi:hypothetical protein
MEGPHSKTWWTRYVISTSAQVVNMKKWKIFDKKKRKPFVYEMCVNGRKVEIFLVNVNKIKGMALAI